MKDKTADIVLEVQVDSEDVPIILEVLKKTFVHINSNKGGKSQ